MRESEVVAVIAFMLVPVKKARDVGALSSNAKRAPTLAHPRAAAPCSRVPRAHRASQKCCVLWQLAHEAHFVASAKDTAHEHHRATARFISALRRSALRRQHWHGVRTSGAHARRCDWGYG